MKPRQLNFISTLSMLLLVASSPSAAQTLQNDNRPRTASIGGRVTISGAPAVNALVMVIEVDPQDLWVHEISPQNSPQKAVIKVRTDNDGRYRVTGLAAGAYMVYALSKAYARSKPSLGSIAIDDGESRDDVDIPLVRGGVITGRVIDSEGRPLIASSIRLWSIDEDQEFDTADWLMRRTDDRGIYRIYGLPVGRYIISAGGDRASIRGRRKYTQTFYPDAPDKDQAKIIEIDEGGEVTGIDIRLGVDKNTYYEASGRVLDSETGQPLPQIVLRCKIASSGEYGKIATTDDEGRFKFTGLSSGRYELDLRKPREVFSAIGNKEYYNEKSRFEVSDSDVNDLEIRAIRGSTISGNVVVEGAHDPAINAILQQMAVAISVSSERGADGRRVVEDSVGIANITGDGAFRVTGLPPGMARFHLEGNLEDIFSIKRIERDGAEIRSQFEIRRGEKISGLRIVVVHANGTIRGQIEIAGGKLPEGLRFAVSASPLKTNVEENGHQLFDSGSRGVWTDEKGRFVIERLAAGEYELSYIEVKRSGQNGWTGVQGTGGFMQRVTVSGGPETTIKFTHDRSRRQPEKRP
jgi:hypothetical protein